MKHLLILGLLLIAPHAGAATSDIRSTLFAEAEQALAEANQAQASVLAPASYAAGSEEYRAAEALVSSGGSIERIRSHLGDATRLFRKAAAATEVARVTLPGAIDARGDALSADAPTHAADEWRDAEVAFANAVKRLEQESVRSARRYGDTAETGYREAELLAIKANYLDETRVLLEEARDLNAKRYAPITLAAAEDLLERAEDGLERNRYDTDEPRSLAQDAKYEARHAIHLAQLGKRFRDGDVTLEETQLQWENAVRGIGDQLDSRVDFSSGPEAATAALVAELSRSQAQWEESQQLVAALTSEAASLETVRQLSAAQEKLDEQIHAVEALFPADQAIVVRHADDVIIRMIGLNFDTGQAVIKTEHYPLLRTLREALAIFPEDSIVIEGHTDAFGSDESNLELSERRAQAVEAYITSLPGFDPARVSGRGFGETRPVANNETAEGRRKNRRIDVVIVGAGALQPI